MATKNGTTNEGVRKQEINRLLRFVELLRQVLEIKQEGLHLFPSFLHMALLQHSSHRVARELAELGEQIVQHVHTLAHVVTNLGGSPEDVELTNTWGDTKDAISTMLFHEELAAQILSECEEVLAHDWDASSQLQVWLHERLETVRAETKQHVQLFERLFASTEPRYRDLVLERFRVTAIP